MSRMTVRSPSLLHLCLKNVTSPRYQPTANKPLRFLEAEVIPIVIVFDNLETPTTGQHIAANQVARYLIGQIDVSGVAKLLYRGIKHQVSAAGQLMKCEQVAAGLLDRLESLRHFAGSFHRRIVRATGTAMGRARRAVG